MFISPYDTPIAVRHLGLIWSTLGMDAATKKRCAEALAPGLAIVTEPDSVEWFRNHAPHLSVLTKQGCEIQRLGRDDSVSEVLSLYENVLPSQIVNHSARTAVALDIIMSESTESAWAQTEDLIHEGVPSETIAAALIGTPSEVAVRLGDYRALGIHNVILTAPFERAPYCMVAEKLLPLLRKTPHVNEMPPHHDGVMSGAFDWHGSAL